MSLEWPRVKLTDFTVIFVFENKKKVGYFVKQAGEQDQGIKVVFPARKQ